MAPPWGRYLLVVVLVLNATPLAVFWFRNFDWGLATGTSTLLVGVANVAVSQLLHMFTGFLGTFRYGPRGLLRYSPTADISLFSGGPPISYVAIPGLLMMIVGSAYLDGGGLRRWVYEHRVSVLGLGVIASLVAIVSGGFALGALLLSSTPVPVLLLLPAIVGAVRWARHRDLVEKGITGVTLIGAVLVVLAPGWGSSTVAECSATWASRLVYSVDWWSLQFAWIDVCNDAGLRIDRTLLVSGIVLIAAGVVAARVAEARRTGQDHPHHPSTER